MNSVQIFFALIRNQLFNSPVPDGIESFLNDEMLDILYKSAKAHDLSTIISSALEKNSLFVGEEIIKKFKNQELLSFYRYTCMKNELDKMREIFSAEKIPFIPLKGAIIRNYYPEPHLRTSSDIDVLVHERDAEAAVKLLKEKAEYSGGENRGYHNYSLYSPVGVHIELHFNLLENMEKIDKLLSRAWEYALPANEGTEYLFTNEFMIFYIIAHMSYHFSCGGCGVRPFIDLLLLEKNVEYDSAILQEMLSECGLNVFYNAAKRLCGVWFCEDEHDELTKKMENFILTGGVNGNKKMGLAAKQRKSGGKLAYFLLRIFQPYGIMKEKYPILKTHKCLLPFYQVKRWFSLLYAGKLSRLKKEYDAGKSMDSKQAEDMNAFLSKLGIE